MMRATSAAVVRAASCRAGPPAGRAALTCLAAAIVAAAAHGVGAERPLAVRLRMADGTTRAGMLEGIDAVEVRFTEDAAPARVAVADVRTLEPPVPPAATAEPGPVAVTLVDGGRLEGDAFTWDRSSAELSRGAGRAALPVDRVLLVTWRRPGDAAAAPPWLGALPERPDTDLVVVGSGTGWECVACAIESVAADAVTVVLDGDRIPVKRSKVLGLRWLREPSAPGGAHVAVAGGRLRGSAVAWSPDGFTVDGARLPPEWLVSIDFAAGRTVRLADVAPERTAVEPAVAALARVEGMASFLAPRTLRPRDPAPEPRAADIVVRPRTVAAWRVPAQSRRFRTTLAPAAWGTAAAGSIVTFDVDGRPAFRGTLGGAGTHAARDPIEFDVSGARLLQLTVDFVDDGFGCPVRLGDPVFEK